MPKIRAMVRGEKYMTFIWDCLPSHIVPVTAMDHAFQALVEAMREGWGVQFFCYPAAQQRSAHVKDHEFQFDVPPDYIPEMEEKFKFRVLRGMAKSGCIGPTPEEALVGWWWFHVRPNQEKEAATTRDTRAPARAAVEVPAKEEDKDQ